MGRPSLSPEAAKESTIQLIRATQALVLQRGIDAVTIRMIAQEAGMNSAVLYRYFKDLDELVLFACVDLLKNYCADLLQNERQMREPTPERRYLMTWDLFCRYAFKQPESINHLFFSRHSNRLDDVIQRYYSLFSEQLSGMPEALRAMLRSGRLQQRNLDVLRPLMDGRVSEERLHMINDLTVSYFQMLLGEKLREKDAADNERLRERMLAACRFLLDAGANE